MPIALDTSTDADAVQVEAYRRMGGTGRVQVMFRLTEMTRRTTEAGIRRRHPDYDDARVMLALARLLHGDELVRRAWPGRDFVEP
jgi:predicted ArsR family transcriptional regulator